MQQFIDSYDFAGKKAIVRVDFNVPLNADMQITEVCYSHLFKNFPQFFVVHLVKGFGIGNKAEIDVFLELSCFFHD